MISVILLALVGLNLTFNPALAIAASPQVAPGTPSSQETNPFSSETADLPAFLDDTDSANAGYEPLSPEQQEKINQAYEKGRLQSPWRNYAEEGLPART